MKWILVLFPRQRHFCQSVTEGYVFKNLEAKLTVISCLICLQICRCKVTFLSKQLVEVSYYDKQKYKVFRIPDLQLQCLNSFRLSLHLQTFRLALIVYVLRDNLSKSSSVM